LATLRLAASFVVVCQDKVDANRRAIANIAVSVVLDCQATVAVSCRWIARLVISGR
jgi:hypothetical protein